MTLVVKGGGQTLNQPDLAINPAQDQRAEIGRHGPAIEIPADGQAGDGRKTQMDWNRLLHGATSFSFIQSIIGVIQIISIG